MAISALVNLSDADAGWGTIAYNGLTFPGLRDVKISSEDVYDKANRTIIFTRYTVRVHAFMTDDDAATQKLTMADLRQKLHEAGQTLTFSGQGIGDIQVNGAASTHVDVEWGPKPKSLELTQVGGLCTEITWECSFSIHDGITVSGPRIVAFNYSVDWNYDEAGKCTRTITGYVQIAQTRKQGDTPGALAARTIPGSADSYRDQLRVAVPNGMRRTDRRFRLSEDRNTLDFNFTDVQLDAEAPPAGVLRAELDYQIQNVPPGFARFSASLGGSIEVPIGTPTIVAAQTFVRIMIDKFTKLKKSAKGEGAVIPMRIQFGRTLGTRESSFAVSWLVTGCLSDLLANGGIWEPIEGSSWQNWANDPDLAKAWSNRGTNNLVFSPTDDAIVDLGFTGALPAMGRGGVAGQPNKGGSSVFKVDGINEKNSWLAYENSLEAWREVWLTTHRHVQRFNPPQASGEGDVATDSGMSMLPVGGTSSRIMQYQGEPTEYVQMKGKAMRLGGPNKKNPFLPAVPRLVSVAGRRVIEVAARTDGPKPVACFFGQTVYVARWAILYQLADGYLSKIPEQPNPALCCGVEK